MQEGYLLQSTTCKIVSVRIHIYLIHDWNPRSPLDTLLSLGSTKRDPRLRRYRMQRHYQCTRAVMNDRLKIAIQDLSDRLNADHCRFKVAGMALLAKRGMPES